MTSGTRRLVLVLVAALILAIGAWFLFAGGDRKTLNEAIADGLGAQPDSVEVQGSNLYDYKGTIKAAGKVYTFKVDKVGSPNENRYIVKMFRQGASESERAGQSVRPRKDSNSIQMDGNARPVAAVGWDGIEIWVFGVK